MKRSSSRSASQCLHEAALSRADRQARSGWSVPYTSVVCMQYGSFPNVVTHCVLSSSRTTWGPGSHRSAQTHSRRARQCLELTSVQGSRMRLCVLARCIFTFCLHVTLLQNCAVYCILGRCTPERPSLQCLCIYLPGLRKLNPCIVQGHPQCRAEDNVPPLPTCRELMILTSIGREAI